ncbi:MAG: hypothetical protein LBJ23_00710 [Tannerella sp.]|jgi:hypothetical protein|nr:hypothetical protein [Tannerella sp.]
MKTKTFLMLGMLLLLTGACKNGGSAEEAYYASLDRQTPEQRMNGRKAHMLFGNVSRVSYDNGSFIEFNEDGNPVREKTFFDIVTKYRYINPTRYFSDHEDSEPDGEDGEPYNIIYNDSMRIEDNMFYTFDEKGRLKEYRHYRWPEYFYYRDNALLPYMTIESKGDLTLLTYTRTDSHGNWLECELITVKECGDEIKEAVATTGRPVPSVLTLSRTIEYFPDDDAGPPSYFTKLWEGVKKLAGSAGDKDTTK